MYHRENKVWVYHVQGDETGDFVAVINEMGEVRKFFTMYPLDVAMVLEAGSDIQVIRRTISITEFVKIYEAA